MYRYQAFGLNINSEIYFPELLEQTKQDFLAYDLLIKYAEVSLGNSGMANVDTVSCDVGIQTLRLAIPEVGKFLITHGNLIVVDPVADIDEESIRLFLLGSCMGAALMQRNTFLLHGNAIKIGQTCISFVGDSGIGKSTLTAAFANRGYAILADDVCAINERHEVLPSYPQIKLWIDVAKHFNIITDSLRKLRPNIDKFALPLAEKFYNKPLPLKVVYVLQQHEKNTFSLLNINGMSKLEPLKNNMYRAQYLPSLGKSHLFLKHCLALASQIEVISVTRPSNGFQLAKLVDLIEEDLQNRKAVTSLRALGEAV